MGRKASFIPKPDDVPKPRYVVVNADESEPGTFKDREIMFRVPHRLIEGCLITAHAIQSQNVFIYIRGEYLAEFEVLRAALDEARDDGLFGDVDRRAPPRRGRVHLRRGVSAARVARGQARPAALAAAVPAVSGLYAAPTLINNVETVATVPKIIELGGAEYAQDRGADELDRARGVFSLSGNVVSGRATTSSSSARRCAS